MNIDNQLEIIENNGERFNIAMSYGDWRVAYLNYAESHKEGNIEFLEKHLETDEVFVLMSGKATLLIGKECARIEMEPCKVYNVKKGVWHNIILSEDAKILLVENKDTSKENSEYLYL